MNLHSNPTVNRNLWFGFYNPSAALPPVASATERSALFDVLFKPVTDDASATDVIIVLGRSLSSLAPVVHDIESGRIAIEVSPGNRPTHLLHEDTTHKITLPQGSPPINWLASLISLLGNATTPPLGLPETSFFRGDLRRFRENFYGVYQWGLSLGKSLLFQVAHEMERRELAPPVPGVTLGCLRPTDLALFRIFRVEGLTGLVASILEYLDSPSRDVMEESIAAVERQITAGAFQMTEDNSWTAPDRGEKPTLPLTAVDAEAERQLGWGKGLYVEDSARALFPKRLREISTLFRQRIRRQDDVRILRNLLQELAPELAAKLLARVVSGEVAIEVTSEPFGDDVALIIPIPQLFGLPSETNPVLKVKVKRGVAFVTALTEMVGDLARAAVPPEIDGSVTLAALFGDDRDRGVIVSFLDTRYRIRGAWALSAQAEFFHQASARGVPLQIIQPYSAMMEVLKRKGLAVLVEKYGEMMGASAYAAAREPFSEYATALFATGKIPLLIRWMRGEEVSREDLVDLSGSLNRELKLLEAARLSDRQLSDVTYLLVLMELIVRQYEALPGPIRERDTLLQMAVGRLRDLRRAIGDGEIEPTTALQLAGLILPHLKSGREPFVRLSPALAEVLRDSVDDFQSLGSRLAALKGNPYQGDLLQERAEEARRWHQQRREARRHQRKEARRAREESEALEKRQRAEEQARDREELARREADGAQRRREAEAEAAREAARQAEEGALRDEERRRRATEAVIVHRRDEIQRLIRHLEDSLLEAVERGLFPIESLTARQVTISSGGQAETIPLRTILEEEAAEIWRTLETAKEKPPSERDATAGLAERMIGLCDRVRIGNSLLERFMRSNTG